MLPSSKSIRVLSLKGSRMARLFYATCFSVLIGLATTSNVMGSVQAESFLNIDNFRLFVDTGAGVPGAAITQGVQGLVTGVSFQSTTSADVLSIPGTDGDGNLSLVSPAGLDSPVSFQGSGAPPVDDSLFPLVSYAGPLPNAVSDTFGDGTIIAGLGFPFGANSYQTSQVHLSTAVGSTDAGNASTTSTATANFSITISAPLSIVGIFDATRDLLADLSSLPPGSTASASTSFSVQVTGPGLVFLWQPGLFILGGTEYSAPFSLNGNLTTPPGGISSFSASTLPIGAAPQFSAGVTLPGIGGGALSTYAFSISQTTQAQASTVGVVPEPASVVAWALLATCGVFASVPWRKRLSA